jgi:hypothetical protein
LIFFVEKKVENMDYIQDVRNAKIKTLFGDIEYRGKILIKE